MSDLAWKTTEWTWDSDRKGRVRQNQLLHYDASRHAYAVRILRQKGDVTPEFSKDAHSCPIKAEKNWSDWLGTVGEPPILRPPLEILLTLDRSHNKGQQRLKQRFVWCK